MPALVAGIHVLRPGNNKDVDGRDIGVLKYAVLRTAMPGHDGEEYRRQTTLLQIIVRRLLTTSARGASRR
jgi:hypothetical protein